MRWPPSRRVETNRWICPPDEDDDACSRRGPSYVGQCDLCDEIGVGQVKKEVHVAVY